MDKKEKIQKLFKYFLVGITIFLFGFACWCAGKYDNDTNNCISAYAVEEENIVNLPFDFVSQDFQPQLLAFFQYNTSTNEYIDNYGYASFAYTPKIFFDKNDLSYKITFNNFSNFLSAGILKIIDCSFYDYMNNFNFANYTLYNLKDYCSIEESYYTLNLNNISFNNLCILQNNTGILLPVMFIEGINNIDNNLTNTIIYDTTNTFQSITYNWNYIINEINYGTFKIKTNSAERNNTYSINGKHDYMPVKDTRYFYLTVENKYQEGYNTGYDTGYANGYEDGHQENVYNPFYNKDYYIMYGYNEDTPAHYPDITTYNSMKQFVGYSILTNDTANTWLYNKINTYVINTYRVKMLGQVLQQSKWIDLQNASNLSFVKYHDDNFTNIMDFDCTITIEFNGGIVVSLSYLQGNTIEIDWHDINGVDYSNYLLFSITVSTTTNIYAVNTYYGFSMELSGTYTDGYASGYNAGLRASNGNYQNGYNAGYNDARTQTQYTFFNLISAIIDTPIYYFSQLFDYELLGINIKNFLLGLLTLGIVLAVIRVSVGKKD